MVDRAKRVQDSIDQSEKDKAHASALLAQYEDRLKSAKTEADEIIRTAKKQAKLEAENILAGSRVLAEQTLDKAKKQLEEEHKAAMELFRKEAASLVIAATGRLVAREIKAEDNQQYAAMLLEDASSLSEPASLIEPASLTELEG
jgi:F-type H+-transporting ATPase subunit b